MLLRLAQLPGGARALCESGAMAALAASRAVDAYAHDSPGDAAAAAAASRARARAEAARAGGADFDAPASYARIGYGDDEMDFAEERGVLEERGGVDPASAAAVAAASPLAPLPLARARHHALLVPVLRLAGTLLNASPDEATREGAVAFCRAHAAVLHRVLADRSKHAHLCDVAELEAAVALVARLVATTTTTTTTRFSAAEANARSASDPSSSSSLSSLSEFIPALDALTARLARGDGKYDHFIAAASDARSSPLARTSHGEVARRVAESAAGGRDAAIGGLSAAVAAAAAAKMEKGDAERPRDAVSAQLSLAERGAAAFAAAERPGRTRAPRPGPRSPRSPGWRTLRGGDARRAEGAAGGSSGVWRATAAPPPPPPPRRTRAAPAGPPRPRRPRRSLPPARAVRGRARERAAARRWEDPSGTRARSRLFRRRRWARASAALARSPSPPKPRSSSCFSAPSVRDNAVPSVRDTCATSMTPRRVTT